MCTSRTARNRVVTLIFLTVPCLAGLGGCESPLSDDRDSATANDNGRAVSLPTTPQVSVISDDPLPDADGRIILGPEHGELQPGFGLVTGNGAHLYKVEDTEIIPGGSLRVTVSQGSLVELGIEGKFRFVDVPDEGAAPKAGVRAAGPGVDLRIIDLSMPFSTTIDLAGNGGASAVVEGQFDLEGVFHLAFDIGLPGLLTFSSYVGGQGVFALDVSVDADAGASASREQAIPGAQYRTYYSGVVAGPAGVPIPVIVELTAQLFVGFEAELPPGSIETGVEAGIDVRVGADYDSERPEGDRWSGIATSSFDWRYDEPAACFAGSGAFSAYLRPHFEVQLYSVLGPTFDVQPQARLDATLAGCLGDPAIEYDAALVAGALGYARIKVDILDRWVRESPRLTVFDRSWDLKTWQNAATPGPTAPITFSLPLDVDPPGRHYYFDQDIGENGTCKSWNGCATCDDTTCDEATYDGHTGTDFPAAAGTPVYAAHSGTILVKKDGRPDGCYPCGPPCHIACGDFDQYRGNHIILDHGDGFRTQYNHLESGTLTCKDEGEQVECGEYLGAVGRSGLATGYHLHFGTNFAAPEGQPVGTPFDPFDGYPYWGTDTADEPAARASFWAVSDVAQRPLKTCDGPPPPECFSDSDCDAGAETCVRCTCVPVAALVVACQAGAGLAIIPPQGSVDVTWSAAVTGGSGPFDFCWGDACTDPQGGDVDGTGMPLIQSYSSSGTYVANLLVTDTITGRTGNASCALEVIEENAALHTLTVRVLGNATEVNGVVTAGNAGSNNSPTDWTSDGCDGDPCTATYDDGDVLTLAAAPATCVNPDDPGDTGPCTFNGWGGDGTCTGDGLSCDVTMDEDQTVTATFSNPFTVEDVNITFSPSILLIPVHPAGSPALSNPVTMTASPTSGGDLSDSQICLDSFVGIDNRSVYDIVNDIPGTTEEDYLRCIMNGNSEICVEPGAPRQCADLTADGTGSYTATFRIQVPRKLTPLGGSYDLTFQINGAGFAGVAEIVFAYSPSTSQVVNITFIPPFLLLSPHPEGTVGLSNPVTIQASSAGGDNLEQAGAQVCLDSFVRAADGQSVYDLVINESDRFRCIMNGVEQICVVPGVPQCGSLSDNGSGVYEATFRVKLPTQLPSLSDTYDLTFDVNAAGFTGTGYTAFDYSPQ